MVLDLLAQDLNSYKYESMNSFQLFNCVMYLCVLGAHLNCFKRFDGFGGEIAHKFITDVHFDKTEPYTNDANDENAISLLLVSKRKLSSNRM